MKKTHVISLMSGTSLDGVDIAFCCFELLSQKWNYKIIEAETIPYNKEWRNKLKSANELDAFHFIELHNQFGNFLGSCINSFIDKKKIQKVDFVSSHGHTIFHQPEKNITFQLGAGASIAAKTDITTISDFRSLDVLLDGQGAPLVPIGDMLLFPEFDYCLNLGGFSNISFNENEKRIAFDICPVNIIINYLANTLNKSFDKNGEIAKKGKLNKNLLAELNNIEYYKKPFPKSLAKEWLISDFIPIIKKFDLTVEDKLRTIYEHIAIQITNITNKKNDNSILITGGGAHNKFLIELLKQKSKNKIVIPDKDIVDFKEALIFAFLGVLRHKKIPNCLSSVTGAKFDNIGGNIYHI
ncbi:MAG: anhydro-N-acetylmuramic acid kinase [Bacteroidetes bacterium]|nr:MAG: anhydro-N-acetylmuramic acid kinase [Bacteroidota bacterium]